MEKSLMISFPNTIDQIANGDKNLNSKLGR